MANFSCCSYSLNSSVSWNNSAVTQRLCRRCRYSWLVVFNSGRRQGGSVGLLAEPCLCSSGGPPGGSVYPGISHCQEGEVLTATVRGELYFSWIMQQCVMFAQPLWADSINMNVEWKCSSGGGWAARATARRALMGGEAVKQETETLCEQLYHCYRLIIIIFTCLCWLRPVEEF